MIILAKIRLLVLLLVLLIGGCATPVTIQRVDTNTVHQQLTRNVLSSRSLSDPTRNVLRQWFLLDRVATEPARAIADLHTAIAQGRAGTNEILAASELAFLHALEGGGRPYFLASALYAYAFSAETPVGALRGRVVVADTGQPLAGVPATLRPATPTSGSDSRPMESLSLNYSKISW